MWVLIYTVMGCCSSGSAGIATANVSGFRTEVACDTTGKALVRKHGGRIVVYHCAKK